MTKQEFTRNYTTIENLLYRFAIKLTKSEARAKDLLQETALKAFTKRASFRGKQFKSWISTILYNTFITDYRASQRRRKLAEHIKVSNIVAPAASETHNSGYLNLLKDDVETQLLKAGPKSRAALSLHTEGYAYKEISEELNVPLGTVKSRINYAREQAKTRIIQMGLSYQCA